MNAIVIFLIEVSATVAAAQLITGYLRPHLKRLLLDLCGTEERAQFWTVFSNILLIGLPALVALSYRPGASGTEAVFFEAIRSFSGNLGAYLTAIVGVGIVISFFSLFARRSVDSEQK